MLALGLGLGLMRQSGGVPVPPSGDTLPTFFKLATVPNQTVSSGTFEVQAIAELLDVTTGTVIAPTVVDASSAVHTMQQKYLQWPGTSENSIKIWYAVVPLLSDQVNTLTVTSGATNLTLPVKHKTTLSTVTVTTAAQLRTQIAAAVTAGTIDVIKVAYNVTDLATDTMYAGDYTNVRNSFVTIKPDTGYSIVCNRDTGAPALFRPSVNYVNWDGVVFGSDTSDVAAGTYYIELNHKVWMSNCQVRGKYKHTWGRETPITASPVTAFRTGLAEGQQVFMTDTLFDGVVDDSSPIRRFTLARDITFNSHRGDFNNFGEVALNFYAIDTDTIRNAANTDYMHNDGFQIWANVATSNVVMKGLKITSPHVPAYLQPFLFDSNPQPSSYDKVMVDTFIIEGASIGTALSAQLAGTMSNIRVSNISMPEQTLTLRRDLIGGFDPLVPTNVFVSNMTVQAVQYLASAGHSNISYNNTNVANVNDASPELTANADLAGITFSSMKVKA